MSIPGTLPKLSIIRPQLCQLLYFCVFFQLFSLISFAATSKTTYTGASIPQFLPVDSRLIFFESDSLFLNGQLLTRNSQYTYDRERGGFDVSTLALTPNDTLVVCYRSAPNWLMKSFEQSLPEISPELHQSAQVFPVPISKRLQSTNLSDISISGAKTFRFTTQTAGTSNFCQSLDLNIQGNLTSDVKLSGTISDRGYNPSYGTANSRLEELDKVNLRLESKGLTAQVGDIQLGHRLYQKSSSDKKISGAAVDVSSKNFCLNGVVARPKGRFSSVSFNGNDGVQGPYQIGEGASAKALVPNSETVWLDGNQLTRGADNDYTMDFPSGRITFSVRHIIDRRSRIEIDYEPISTDYKTELYSTGAGYRVGDSAINAAVEWYREGDISDQPQTGQLSDNDRKLLAAVGDSIDQAERSGVRPDTLGDYMIVGDSLPDSVYQFVGNKNGDFSISFSFVGSGKGDYKFAGGDQYYYVGANKGDYRAIRKLSVPQRTDFFTSRFGVNNAELGSIQTELSLSQFDKNLFSKLDDSNNDGILLNLDSKKQFNIGGHVNDLQLRLRFKEATYDARSRLNTVDFGRQYLLPLNYSATADERLYEAQTNISPFKNVTICPSLGRLNYRNNFTSDKVGLSATLGASDKLNGNLVWGRTDGQLLSTNGRNGDASTIRGAISAPISKSIGFKTEYEHDQRKNNYNGNSAGLRYDHYAASIQRSTEQLSYEYYTEDSLSSNWSQSLTRNRFSGSSKRHFGIVDYNAYLGYQWLTRLSGNEQSFLGRTDFHLNDTRRQLALTAAYSLSKETRNARGIAYLEVPPGQGNYGLEEGRYVPDPNGNFIQVEELLSDRSKVNRGEKSFQFSKSWSGAQVRFNSSIDEELLENGRRKIWWLIPFLSDDSQPYLVYNRNYNGEMRLIPVQGAHVINISADEHIEIRSLSGIPRTRQDRAGSLAVKQVVANYFLEQRIKLFSIKRDDYYIGSGDINGYQVGGSIRRPIKSNEITFGSYFRRASSTVGETCKTISISGESRMRMIEKGELRSALEVYHQVLENSTLIPSYQLTDNKSGTKGAIWSTAFNYSIKKGMRINLNLSGRHSNANTARITGRAEVVAEF